MRIFVGVHDPRAEQNWRPVLANAASVLPEDVFQIGSLMLAGAFEVARSGSITSILSGDIYETHEVVERLALSADASPALVVARGYERDGMSFLSLLRGSYQLVLWDDATHGALIAQDHLSASAVFYHSGGSRTSFASDISPLLRVLPTRPSPDAHTIPRWITDRALPDGLTLYEGVRRLRMGWSLYLNQTRQDVRRIWAPTYVSPEVVDPMEAGVQIRAGVEKAVRRRLGPDGTTGILLSGGFDSGTLAGIAAPLLRERGHTLPAYSTVFPGEAYDESAGIDALTSELGLPSTRVRVRGGTVATALNFQQRWDLPQPAPGAILDQPLLALAHQGGHRVMLDGQGGDELFAASPYLLTDYVWKCRWRNAYRLAHQFPNVGDRLKASQLRWFAKQLVVKGALPHAAHRLLADLRHTDDPGLQWLTAASRRRADELEDPWAWKRGAAGCPRWWALLTYLLLGARELAGAQDFLRRRGELFGVESRQPLMVDVDLVELMLRMPPDLAFSRRYDRALAREAVRGIVPEVVRVPVRKSDYSTLMHLTLAKHDFEDLRRVLAACDAEIGAYVNLEAMRRTLLESVPSVGDPGWQLWGQRIWALTTTEIWLRSHSMGPAFTRWIEDLRLTPCRIEILRAPWTDSSAISSSFPPFFHLVFADDYAYSHAHQQIPQGGTKAWISSTTSKRLGTSSRSSRITARFKN